MRAYGEPELNHLKAMLGIDNSLFIGAFCCQEGRLAQSESVRMGPDFQSKLEITEKSFMNRATVSFNKLPAELRQIRKIETFKKQLKIWVLKNCKL